MLFLRSTTILSFGSKAVVYPLLLYIPYMYINVCVSVRASNKHSVSSISIVTGQKLLENKFNKLLYSYLWTCKYS